MTTFYKKRDSPSYNNSPSGKVTDINFLGNQGGQVGYSTDVPYYPGGSCSTPTWVNQQQQKQLVHVPIMTTSRKVYFKKRKKTK